MPLRYWLMPFQSYAMWIAFQFICVALTLSVFIQYGNGPGVCGMSGEQIGVALLVASPGAIVIYRSVFLASRAVSRLVARVRGPRW